MARSRVQIVLDTVAGGVALLQVYNVYQTGVVNGDWSLAIIHALLGLLIVVTVLLSKLRRQRLRSPGERLGERVADDLEKPMQFLMMNTMTHAEDKEDFRFFCRVASEYFDVDEDRLRTEHDRLVCDMEVFSRTGRFPDE